MENTTTISQVVYGEGFAVQARTRSAKLATCSNSTPRRWSPTRPTFSLSLNTGVAVLRPCMCLPSRKRDQSAETTISTGHTDEVREGTSALPENGNHSRSGRNQFPAASQRRRKVSSSYPAGGVIISASLSSRVSDGGEAHPTHNQQEDTPCR